MNNNLNSLTNKNDVWLLTINNFYSYDSLEKTSAIYINKVEAEKAFDKEVLAYYNSELEMANELFSEDISSLKDIIKACEELNKLTCKSVIKFVEYKYGIEYNDNFKKCTISRLREENIYNDIEEKYIEEVYIILEKVSLNTLNRTHESLLENYEDLDVYVKNINC